MHDPREIEAYNYANFVGGDDFLAFRTARQVGSSAPDFGAISLETGREMKLSEHWANHDVLVEFGSLT